MPAKGASCITRSRAGSSSSVAEPPIAVEPMAELAGEVQKNLQSELTKFLRSDKFNNLLKASIASVLSEMVKSAVQPLESEIARLESKIEQLESKANNNEQYSRRSNVRIYGLENVTPAVVGVEGNEDCVNTALTFFNEHLGLDLSRSNIDRSHRVGKANDAGYRALIVKFASYEAKQAVMRVRKNLKGSKVYINEDLTWSNQQLYKKARDVCKNKAWVFTADGYILVKQVDQNPVRIKSQADLEELGFL